MIFSGPLQVSAYEPLVVSRGYGGEIGISIVMAHKEFQLTSNPGSLDRSHAWTSEQSGLTRKWIDKANFLCLLQSSLKKVAHHPIVVDVVAEEDIPTFIVGAINDGMYIVQCTVFTVWCNDGYVHNHNVNYQVRNNDDDDD